MSKKSQVVLKTASYSSGVSQLFSGSSDWTLFDEYLLLPVCASKFRASPSTNREDLFWMCSKNFRICAIECRKVSFSIEALAHFKVNVLLGWRASEVLRLCIIPKKVTFETVLLSAYSSARFLNSDLASLVMSERAA